MRDMGTADEFAEFETTEEQIDAMMAAGQPVEVRVPGERTGLEGLYRRVHSTVLSWGGTAVTRQITSPAPLVSVAGPVKVASGAAV